MVLTFKQYKQRHAKKLEGLNNSEKAKRYNEYMRNAARGAPAPRGAPKGAPKSRAVGKQIAETAASFLPGPLKFLSPIAGGVGGMLGEGIGTLLGLGDYKVKKNSIISEGNTPAYMHSKKGSTFVRHREFITNVYSSATAGAFSVQNFPIQAGLTSSMPWLSLLTRGFQEWQPHGIVYEFKSNTGMISSAATPAIGMVIMATDYDSYDTNPFTNKLDMENTQYTTNAKATESFYHPVECAPNKNILDRLFLRDDTVPQGQPPQFYDLGTFAIGSIGTPVASQNLGELWVTYEIELMKPTMKRHDSSTSAVDFFYTDVVQTGKSMFGSYKAGLNNTLGGSIEQVDVVTSKYTFPSNVSLQTYYMIWMVDLQASTLVDVAPVINVNNCDMVSNPFLSPGANSLPSIFTAAGDHHVYGAPNLGTNSTFLTWIARIEVFAPGAWFEFDNSGMTFPGNQDAGHFYLIRYPSNSKVGALPPPLPYPRLRSPAETETERRAMISGARADPDAQKSEMIEHLRHQLAELQAKTGTPTPTPN